MTTLPQVFVSFDGDKIGRLVGRARLADDVAEVRRISQRIDLGQETWRGWALRWGGDIISLGGDEGSVQINAAALEELEGIRTQYKEKTGLSVSVGVGTKLSEADKAVLVAKHRGGDRIVLWSDEMNDEVQEIMDSDDPHDKKMSEAYLQKSGFQGNQVPARPLSPSPEGSEHSQGEAIRNMIEREGQGGPERTHTADEIAEMFHQLAAQRQGSKQQEQPPQQDEEVQQIKQGVAQALAAVKEQIPVLEQVKQQAPEVYASVVGLANAVSMMARKLLGGQQEQPMQKSERNLIKSDDVLSVDCDEHGHTWGEDGAGPYCIMCGGDMGILGGPDGGVDEEERKKKQIEQEAAKEEEVEKEELDKATLHVNALSGENQRHNVLLPVASSNPPGPNGRKGVAGRTKVLDQDSGTEKWRQVRSGMVQSPDGTPTSARNPKAD